MSTADPPQKPERRWYRFSLKTLLIAMTITTVTFGGWVQIRRQQAQENRDRLAAIKSAVTAIEELGGALGYESGELRRKTWLERQFDDPGGPDDPIVVLHVTRVSFNVPSFGIDGALKRSTSLKNVTDEKLEPLKELTDLEDLDLSGTNITDAGLEHVQGLTKLEFLDVMDTQVTKKASRSSSRHCRTAIFAISGASTTRKISVSSRRPVLRDYPWGTDTESRQPRLPDFGNDLLPANHANRAMLI